MAQQGPMAPACALAIREPVLTREIAVLTRTGRSLSPAAERLTQVLHEHMRGRSLRRKRSLD